LKLRLLIKESNPSLDRRARKVVNDVIAPIDARTHVVVPRVSRVVETQAGHDFRPLAWIDLGLEVSRGSPSVVLVGTCERRARRERSRAGLTGSRRRRESNVDLERRKGEVDAAVQGQTAEGPIRNLGSVDESFVPYAKKERA
jgi:hypothetical protein